MANIDPADLLEGRPYEAVVYDASSVPVTALGVDPVDGSVTISPLSEWSRAVLSRQLAPPTGAGSPYRFAWAGDVFNTYVVDDGERSIAVREPVEKTSTPIAVARDQAALHLPFMGQSLVFMSNHSDGGPADDRANAPYTAVVANTSIEARQSDGRINVSRIRGFVPCKDPTGFKQRPPVIAAQMLARLRRKVRLAETPIIPTISGEPGTPAIKFVPVDTRPATAANVIYQNLLDKVAREVALASEIGCAGSFIPALVYVQGETGTYGIDPGELDWSALGPELTASLFNQVRSDLRGITGQASLPRFGIFQPMTSQQGQPGGRQTSIGAMWRSLRSSGCDLIGPHYPWGVDPAVTDRIHPQALGSRRMGKLIAFYLLCAEIGQPWVPLNIQSCTFNGTSVSINFEPIWGCSGLTFDNAGDVAQWVADTPQKGIRLFKNDVNQPVVPTIRKWSVNIPLVTIQTDTVRVSIGLGGTLPGQEVSGASMGRTNLCAVRSRFVLDDELWAEVSSTTWPDTRHYAMHEEKTASWVI